MKINKTEKAKTLDFSQSNAMLPTISFPYNSVNLCISLLQNCRRVPKIDYKEAIFSFIQNYILNYVKVNVHPNAFKPHQIFRLKNYWLANKDINSLVLKSFTTSMVSIHHQLTSLNLSLNHQKNYNIHKLRTLLSILHNNQLIQNLRILSFPF